MLPLATRPILPLHHRAHAAKTVTDWPAQVRSAADFDKPVMQPLYVDLANAPETLPEPIHLGYRTGARRLRNHLMAIEQIGINHVAITLRFNRADIETTSKQLAKEVLSDLRAFEFFLSEDKS